MAPTPRAISRRSVLLGGAGAVVLAACGGDGGDRGPRAGDDDSNGGGGATGSEHSLLAFFDGRSTLVPGRPQRAPFGLGDAEGALVKDGPAHLTFTVVDGAGRPVGDPFKVDRHDAGLPRAYYPVRFTVAEAGTYGVTTTVAGERIEAAFEVSPAGAVEVPGTGDAMPVVDTPTTADAGGVDPICTRQPACPLHGESLRAALAASRPVALLISTPAYCQTAICGPVLDVLLGQRDDFADRVAFLHAEVFRNAREVEQKGTSATPAPIMRALNLTFEPCLFLVGGDGRIRRRVDVIFDEVELRRSLEELVA